MKSMTSLKASKQQFDGIAFRAHLSIYPQSEDLLIGVISDAEYSEVQYTDKVDYDAQVNEATFKKYPMSEPFEIHLNNSMVDSMSVERKMTSEQINPLKVIIGQLQFDPKDIEVRDNNAFHKKVEQTIDGFCETIYEVSPLPESHIQIQKTRNYANCTELTGLMHETNKKMDDNVHSEETRITLSGTLNDYTIKSSTTTDKTSSHDKSYSTVQHVSLELESREECTKHPEIQSENLLHIDNLFYKNDIDLEMDSSKERDGDETMKGNNNFYNKVN